MQFMQWLANLNLYESNSTDEHSVKIQRWSTRIYILTLSLNNTKLITQALSKNLLDAQMQGHIDAFKKNTPNKFYRELMFIRDFLYSNAFLPAAQTFSTFRILYNRGYWSSFMNMNDIFGLDNVVCHCHHYSTCQTKAGFFGNDLYAKNDINNIYAYLDVRDGWYTGCLPINSLLFSMLKSFYNQTMVDSLSYFFVNSSGSFKCLDANERTSFPPSNTTIDTIFSASFIGEWKNHINYSSYFDMCAPKSCAYATNERFNIFYIINAVLAVYGGFAVVLRFSILMIVKLVIRRQQEIPTPAGRSSRLRKLGRTLLKLNLFKSAMHVEPFDIYKQKCSTWLYIVLLIFAFIILTRYTTVRKQIIRIDLDNPTLDIILELKERYNVSSIQCPCSQLSVPLKYFVKLTPTYHEMCSSRFISDDWISLLNHLFSDSYTGFGQSGPAFKVLRLFCDRAERTVNDTVDLFYKTQLVTMNLLTHDLFTAQMNSTVHSFKLGTLERFSRSLELLRGTTRVNQFIAVQTDGDHLKGNLIIRNDLVVINGSSCSHIIDRDCKQPFIIITYDGDFKPIVHLVPNLYASFYSVESLLLSQPQCLYNQSFIELVLRFKDAPPYINFTALSEPSRFSINTTFASIANNLFIQSWGSAFNYTAYFEQCRPRSYSYTVNQTPPIVSVISTIVGLLGGLSALFRFVIPRIVTFVFARFHRQAQQEESSENVQRKGKNVQSFESYNFIDMYMSTGCYNVRILIVLVWNKVRESVITLNLFENVDKPHPPEEEIHIQRRSTRIYLVIIILILAIIMLFTALTYQTNTITVNKPTINVYRNFEHPIDCPCTNLSIPYHIFLDLDLSFHEICSSSFIDQRSDWMAMLYAAFSYQLNAEDNVNTFQRMALSHFQALQVMCNTATKTIKNELSLFLNSTLVSTHIIDFDVFEKQINATLFDFKSSSASSHFLQSFQLIRAMFFSNGFISAFGTNWSPFIRKNTNDTKIYWIAREYNLSSCNCAMSSTCVQTMNLELKSGSLWPVPGMMSGCSPLESMFQSTLECLYDQACLDLISFTLDWSVHYFALTTNHTRFHPINSTTLDSIIAELFIEQWFVNVSFESYFNACHPNSCSYTLSKRFNILYISSTLLTVYKGLSIVLELSVPIILKFSYKYLRKQRNRQVVPISVS
jgi:hypothetical protein